MKETEHLGAWPEGHLPFGRPMLDLTRDGCRIMGALTDVLMQPDVFSMALDGVSEHRRQKVLAYRFEKDRRTSLLAALLLDELLRERGLRERDMSYLEGEQGKPRFCHHEDLHFSLAHSRNAAIAALSCAPVGIDIEYLPDFPHDIADPHMWTEMESVGKMLGCGVGAFVDSRSYDRPRDVAVEHATFGDYLVCIARPRWFNMESDASQRPLANSYAQ